MNTYEAILAACERGQAIAVGYVQASHRKVDADSLGTDFGHGFLIERTYPVPSIGGKSVVLGAVKLWVASHSTAPEQQSLYVQLLLSWVGSEHGEHVSFAECDLDTAAALELESVPQGRALAHLSEDQATYLMGRRHIYNCRWVQQMPGRPTSEEWEQGLAEISFVYHAVAIAAVKKLEPRLFGMLTDTDYGPIAPAFLPALLEWVLEQPEVASVS